MKSINSFLFWIRIVGVVITILVIMQPVFDLPREIKEGNTTLFNYILTDFFYNSYLNPNHGVLIYLVGYAIVWWKQLLGSIIIIAVSIMGFVFSEYGDIRFMYVLIFLVGLLYFLYWYDKRKKSFSGN